MLTLLKFWRELLIVALASSCFAIYKLYPRIETRQLPPIVVERVTTKTVTKTVTTKPDGTVIAVEQEESKDAQIPKPVPIIKLNPYKYSIGVAMRNLDYKDLFFDVGARLGSTPIVAFVGYGYRGRSFLLGVRYEF